MDRATKRNETNRWKWINWICVLKVSFFQICLANILFISIDQHGLWSFLALHFSLCIQFWSEQPRNANTKNVWHYLNDSIEIIKSTKHPNAVARENAKSYGTNSIAKKASNRTNKKMSWTELNGYDANNAIALLTNV